MIISDYSVTLPEWVQYTVSVQYTVKNAKHQVKVMQGQ